MLATTCGSPAADPSRRAAARAGGGSIYITYPQRELTQAALQHWLLEVHTSPSGTHDLQGSGDSQVPGSASQSYFLTGQAAWEHFPPVHVSIVVEFPSLHCAFDVHSTQVSVASTQYGVAGSVQGEVPGTHAPAAEHVSVPLQ